MTRVVFLDRDGVINRKMPEGDYVKKWEEFAFLPGVKEALKNLKAKGFLMFIVTNQRGISRGIMTEEDLENIHNRMQGELEASNGKIDKIYYCPHEDGQCNCRKPQVGLFLKAKSDYPNIEFKKSFMVGDSINDMEAGSKLGCRNIMIAPLKKQLNMNLIFKSRGVVVETMFDSLLNVSNYIASNVNIL